MCLCLTTNSPMATKRVTKAARVNTEARDAVKGEYWPLGPVRTSEIVKKFDKSLIALKPSHLLQIILYKLKTPSRHMIYPVRENSVS